MYYSKANFDYFFSSDEELKKSLEILLRNQSMKAQCKLKIKF